MILTLWIYTVRLLPISRLEQLWTSIIVSAGAHWMNQIRTSGEYPPDRCVVINQSRNRGVSDGTTKDQCMKSQIIRPLVVAGLALSVVSLGGGMASAESDGVTIADAVNPVAGSVELCVPVPLGPVEFSLCL